MEFYLSIMSKLSTMAIHSIAELAAKKFLNVPIRKMPEHPFPLPRKLQCLLTNLHLQLPLQLDL
jgi:hypothetical protein